MLKLIKSAIGGAAMAATIAAGSLVSVPPANAEPGVYGTDVIKVGGRGGKGGKNWSRNWNGGGHHNYGHHNYGHYDNDWNNNWWVGPAIGLGTGFIVGSLVARPRYSASGNHDAYCHSRFRSYNSYTGTYTGYDGLQHYC